MVDGVGCTGKLLLITDRKRSCGKVMFLHLSVILFTGGVSLSMKGGVSVQGGLCQADHPIWLRAGGTHLTGMHSCYVRIFSCSQM